MGAQCDCKGEGCRTKVDTKAAVEETLMEAFSQRFRLANASAFHRPDHQRRFGLLGEKEAVQALLEGTLDLNAILDEVEKQVLQLFEQCKELRAKGLISIRITKEDFIKYWRKV